MLWKIHDALKYSNQEESYVMHKFSGDVEGGSGLWFRWPLRLIFFAAWASRTTKVAFCYSQWTFEEIEVRVCLAGINSSVSLWLLSLAFKTLCSIYAALSEYLQSGVVMYHLACKQRSLAIMSDSLSYHIRWRFIS